MRQVPLDWFCVTIKSTGYFGALIGDGATARIHHMIVDGAPAQRLPSFSEFMDGCNIPCT